MISRELIKWYEKHKRDLPWRATRNPYLIWLSEIILQQTRVEQGLPYYLKFVENFPTVADLAKASEEKLLKLWQGLGYYSRARNLHFAAKTIVKEHNGVFPTTYSEIKKLKGVGDYTAAAIASFAFDEPYAVVDGNVYRVLSRLFEINTPINSATGKVEFMKLAQELLDVKNAASNNQAIMELGAMVCKPKNPLCSSCCVRSYCYAFKNNSVQLFPVKEKKLKIRNRYFYYLVITDKKNNIILNKRGANDIWQGLYDFPLIEHTESKPIESVLTSKEFKKTLSGKNVVKKISTYFLHQLSHQKIHAKFIEVVVSDCSKISFEENNRIVSLKKIKNYAIPRLIEKYWKERS
ncbi:MAG: A/G-specific adenine glycosylase [Bacteroidetes bacterium]|nr:A/G-specific adenine glycosylase [Bacteroidota bacterium]